MPAAGVEPEHDLRLGLRQASPHRLPRSAQSPLIKQVCGVGCISFARSWRIPGDAKCSADGNRYRFSGDEITNWGC